MAMKERSVDRVVGNLPNNPNIKDQILKRQRDVFEKQGLPALKDLERAKFQEEIHIIGLVNKITNDLLADYGLPPFDIPVQNVHVIFQDKWMEDNMRGGNYLQFHEAILLKEVPYIVFARMLMHDMIHMKFHNAVQITTGQNPRLTTYRNGIYVVTRDGKTRQLDTLNEALVEELTIRYFPRLLEDPVFTADIRHTEKIMERVPRDATLSGGGPLSEVYYAYLVPEKEPQTDPPPPSVAPSVGGRINVVRSQRFVERGILNKLIGKIFKSRGSAITEQEDVFRVFARAALTGKILPFGRLIDDTFGKGTVRKFAELQNDNKKEEDFVNNL